MPSYKHEDLFLPELMSPHPGGWEKFEVDIQDSAVDLENRQAYVPRAYTPAQKLARLHEGGHVKYSPKNWRKHLRRVMEKAEAMKPGKKFDPRAADKISKMLEENRIDWILWDRHGIDLRPCRETLDWNLMSEPPSVLYALGMCLQLAWTVWASRGLGSKTAIINPPPHRTVDVTTGEYFDRCWAVVTEENTPLAQAMIKACLRMYVDSRHEMRDAVASELLTFFPLEDEPEDKPPPPKKEEKQAQEKAEQEEQDRADYLDKLETGVGGEVVTEGGIQYHDHTATVQRPSMRIAQRSIPVPQGIGLRYPHRWFLDKAIFSQRLLTEAGIMVDGSGSMAWTNEDMQLLMAKLPAVQVGVYSGVNDVYINSEKVYGRICIVAKGGKFARFEGLDPECNGSNDIDYEALQLLARWPKPRLWLSDGQVCGGRYSGKPSIYTPATGVYASYGRLMEMCNALMKQYEIYRVPNREVMHQLLNRQRVTLYRSCDSDTFEKYYCASNCTQPPQPVTFQL